MKFYSTDIKVGFNDVLIVPQRSDIPSRTDVNLFRVFEFKHSKRQIEGVPIIAANMTATGTFAMADAFGQHHMFTALHKHYSEEELLDFFGEDEERWSYTFYTAGLNDLPKLKNIQNKLGNQSFPHLLNLDVANGLSESFAKVLKEARREFHNSVIMAGNVVGGNMAEHIILCGADIVKVGIGPGSVCTTRVKCGVGFPQLSAIGEASFNAHGLKGHICGDGGCTRVGDICKGFAAGGDFMMIGGMIAGTDECEGEWVRSWKERLPKSGRDAPKKYFKFYGMASEEAQNKYNDGLKDYKAAEGKCVEIPYKGPVSEIIREIKGGISSACSYVGASKIKDIPRCASFVRCTQQENTIFGG